MCKGTLTYAHRSQWSIGHLRLLAIAFWNTCDIDQPCCAIESSDISKYMWHSSAMVCKGIVQLLIWQSWKCIYFRNHLPVVERWKPEWWEKARSSMKSSLLKPPDLRLWKAVSFIFQSSLSAVEQLQQIEFFCGSSLVPFLKSWGFTSILGHLRQVVDHCTCVGNACVCCLTF